MQLKKAGSLRESGPQRRHLALLVSSMLLFLYQEAATSAAATSAGSEKEAMSGNASQVRMLLRRKTSNKTPPLGSGFWRVRGHNFMDAHGRYVRFSGVNWSGLETPDQVPHGLDRRSLDSHLDQMRSLGLTMLRIPFSGDTVKSSTRPQQNIVGSNPTMQGLNSLQVLDRLISGCGKRGMKVILDYHRIRASYDKFGYGLWWDSTSPEETWINNWKFLAWRYRRNPTVIGADLFNEVHDNSSFPSGAPFWEYSAGSSYNEKFNFRRATVRAIKHIHSVEPNWIFFLEGMWNNYWWGGNCGRLMLAPITSPAGKIAFSAHDYGPNVYPSGYFFDKDFPKNMPGIYNRNWGHIVRAHWYPVWIGEFGSKYPDKTNPSDTTESTAFESLVAYMRQLKVSWTYWQWGPEYADTGGILNDDWTTVNKRKMDLLKTMVYRGFKP